MSVITLLKKTFTYKLYHNYQVKKWNKRRELRKECFQLEGVEVLKNFSEALNSKQITFWLEFGTLLGFYREHDFIKHDCDLDFGAYLKDADKIKKALESYGFRRIILFNASDGGMEECYKYKHTTLDVFYFREDEGGLYCNSFGPQIINTLKEKFSNRKKCYVKKIYIPSKTFSQVEYKGCMVNIPTETEKHLKMHYGEYFMIPNPQFDYKKEATNIVYYNLSEVSGYSILYGTKE